MASPVAMKGLVSSASHALKGQPANAPSAQKLVTQPPNYEPEIDINNNSRAFIENPLRRHSPEGLEAMVARFVEEQGLHDIGDLLHKGAQIGRDPFAPQVVTDLSEPEREALKDENRHRFRHPPKFWLTISLLCCGAILQ